jgi:hypothetical protein
MVAVPGCNEQSKTTDRWVTTENTNVDIDWDAVAEAYKQAEGPEDFEQRVNEIYTGDEVISVAVRDVDDKTQVVTGFFDENGNGQVEDGEKIFSLNREIASEDKGHMQIQGYGHYAGYHSPMWDIAGGMLLGSMISRAFMPGYRPMYTQPYVTSVDRRGALVSHRDSYRAANPDKFRQGSSSRSGRSYGRKGGAFGGGSPTPSRPRAAPSRGGGRFGARRPVGRKVIRLV